MPDLDVHDFSISHPGGAMKQAEHIPRRKLDPLFVHARREAIVILVVWVICLAWTTAVYWTWGLGRSPEEVEMYWGIPDWVFVGVVAPWVVVDIFSIWYCLVFMCDDELGHANEGLDLDEEVAQMHHADQDRVDD